MADYVYDSDTVFAEPGIITDTVTLSENIEFKNYSDLRGTLIIQYGARIYNWGQITGDVNAMSPASVTQYITGPDNAHKISNLSGHIVRVENINANARLELNDLLVAASGASAINIDNAHVWVGPNITEFGTDINLGDAVTFYLYGIKPGFSGIVVNRLHNAVPNVVPVGLDSMYLLEHTNNVGPLYVRLVRQTDYSIVFGGELGKYLNDLRANGNADNFIAALDTASSRAELQNVLNGAANINPILLMQPVRSFMTLENMPDMGVYNSGMWVRPVYTGGGYGFWGAHIGAGFSIMDNMFAMVDVFAGRLSVSDDYDTFTGMFGGGTFAIEYFDSDVFVSSSATVSIARFGDITLFDGNSIVDGARGIGADLFVDVGPVFNVMKLFDVIPVIGLRTDYISISGFNDNSTNARLGMNIAMRTNVDGNRYNSGVKSGIQTDGAIYFGVYTNILSVFDDVGGGLDIGLVYDDVGFSYQISANAKFIF